MNRPFLAPVPQDIMGTSGNESCVCVLAFMCVYVSVVSICVYAHVYMYAVCACVLMCHIFLLISYVI